MTYTPNHRELFVYENQDRLSLKEISAELNITMGSLQKMKDRVNRFFGRKEKKKRIS